MVIYCLPLFSGLGSKPIGFPRFPFSELMKAGQRADSNFQNFNDIDTAYYGTVVVKKQEFGQYPTILTLRLVSV